MKQPCNNSFNMARIVVATCLAVLVLTLAATSVDASRTHHRQPPKCSIPHGHTVLADSQAILYRNIQPFEFSIVYGCAFARGHSFELGEFPTEGSCGPSACSKIHQEKLAGPLVAYEYFFVAGESGEQEEKFLIIVRDLRSGHVLHKVPTGIPRPENAASAIGAGFATTIVLKSDGAVAWINERPLGEATEYQVHALDKTGNRLLATGTDIDPHSLALAGSTLYWTQGGKPYSTRLT
jgi:hypothetical protein